jgi:PKD repeat protein
MVGIWSVTASWVGDGSHEGASSAREGFIVHVPPEASFTYSPSANLSVFTFINFSDTSTDLDGTILSWLWDFGDNTTSSDQNQTHIYADVGDYNVTLTVTDNDGYGNATLHSITILDIVPSSITCSFSLFAVPVGGPPVITSEVPLGSLINISGFISPPISNATVTLTYTKPDGSTFTKTSTTTPSNYSDIYTPDMGGTWSISASWEGDATHEGATSSSISFTVIKPLTSITCSVLASELPIGSSVTVTGSLSPPVSSAIVMLTYTNPDGDTFTRTSTTNPGDYSDVYSPDMVGSWIVVASWGGDATHEGASSSAMSFIIKSSECLIATATYGSELSQNVQFLRGFRDNDVLKTFAGSSFMTVFNGFYYSFSPDVASVISSNEALRGLMKVVLYPLMGILQLSSATFSIFSFNQELGIVMAGLVASVLIGVFYFLPFALLLSLVRKIKISAKSMRIISLIWAGNVMMIFIAGVIKSPLIMMVSTGAFVLITISAAMLGSLRIILKRFI